MNSLPQSNSSLVQPVGLSAINGEPAGGQAPAPETSRRGESVLRAAFDKMEDGLLIISASGRILYYNQQYIDLHSVPKEWATTESNAERVQLAASGVRDPESFLRRVAEIYRTEGRVEDLVYLKNGRILERISYPIARPAGADVERVWIFRDVTARKEEETATGRRLETLTRPTGDIGAVRFEELFDLEEIQRIQDLFSNATGVASIITHTDGTPITRPSNFCHLCNDIIRQTPAGRANCYCSDAVLGRHNPDGPIVQPCLSGGLWDAGASITAGGQHIANWLIGQVRDGTQTEEGMLEYARKIGADEGAFIAAFRKVPAMSREQFNRVAQLLFAYAQQLSRSAYQNLQQARYIAERKRTEEALRISERKLAEIFRSSPELICVSTMEEGRFLEVNETGCRLLGYERDEAIGHTSFEVGMWQTPADRSKVVDQLREHGRVQNFETQLRKKSGGFVDVLLSMVPIVMDQRPCLITLATDISSRKRAENALRASEARLAEVFANMDGPVFVLNAEEDGSLRYESLNPRSEQMTGLKTADVRGRSPEEVLSPENAALLMPRYRECRDKGKVMHHEAELTYAPGRRLWRTTLVPIRNEFGRVYRIAGFAYDMTELRKAESERLELERRMLHTQKLESLGVLAGGIAHDFNNLLMAILGNLDLALADLSPVAPARESIEQSVIAARRAADLTRQMLAYSGKGRLDVRKIDLSELVEENAHLFRTSISKLVTLNLQLSREVPLIKADAGQLQQIVMNLITNASEAVGDRVGVITLATGLQDCDAATLRRSRVAEIPQPGRFVYVDVSDTGCGMNADTQQRLFDPFFTTKFTGRGLGMSAILGIVRGHDGAILVDSEVGKGSSVRVLFPAIGDPPSTNADAQPSAADGPPAEADPRAEGTILLVDDEEMVRFVCKRMLGQYGWEVLTAADGPEAIRLFRQDAGRITCVLLDLSMPQMDGVAVFRELRAIKADAKVILSSGYGSDQSAGQRLSEEGLNGFIQKPYRADALRREIARVLKLD